MVTPALDHLGFCLKSSGVVGSVYIPRYYNPEIAMRLEALSQTHDLVCVGDLLTSKELTTATGDEIGKMAYGTGPIPFVRTSDISNWEIKADPKQGVSEDIYSLYSVRQDVKPGDVLFVRDGTYLIGAACLVTPHDGRLLYQSHILKFRLKEGARISGPLFLAALYAPVVRRQIRAKQFTADIIDSVGNRYGELILPIPKRSELRDRIHGEVLDVVNERARLREELKRIPYLAQGLIRDLTDPLPSNFGADDPDERSVGFLLRRSEIRRNVLLPRYYVPTLEEEIRQLTATHDLISLGDLTKQGALAFETGIEVGKMAYGTGPVPFIRTSDISNWELKADPKQSVSVELYEQFKESLGVKAKDIFLVRDGTYLVGTSCILTEDDTRLLYCGGIYKIRLNRQDLLDPYLLLALLNSPIVRKQMRSKQFTRDVIDTLGKRIFEVILPIPKEPTLRRLVAEQTRDAVQTRVRLRRRVKEIALEVEGASEVSEDDAELLEVV